MARKRKVEPVHTQAVDELNGPGKELTEAGSPPHSHPHFLLYMRIRCEAKAGGEQGLNGSATPAVKLQPRIKTFSMTTAGDPEPPRG